MMIITGACAGVLDVWGCPVLALILYRFFEFKNMENGNFSTLLSPTLRVGGWLSAGTTLIAWVYAAILDPWLPAARSYTSHPSCDGWHNSAIASVFVTSDYSTGASDLFALYLFLVMPAYALSYSMFCRSWGVKPELWKGQTAWVQRIPYFDVLLMVLQIGAVLCLVARSIESGDVWFESTIKRTPASVVRDPDAVQNTLTGDTSQTILTAILGGVACSVMHQRWAIAPLGQKIHRAWFLVIFSCLCPQFMWQLIDGNRDVNWWVFSSLWAGSIGVSCKEFFTLRRAPGGTGAYSKSESTEVKRPDRASIYRRLAERWNERKKRMSGWFGPRAKVNPKKNEVQEEQGSPSSMQISSRQTRRGDLYQPVGYGTSYESATLLPLLNMKLDKP